MGPYPLVHPETVMPSTARWWSDRFERLAASGGAVSADEVSFANASAPVSALIDAGGFDEAFRGWGIEDREFGLRLIRAGTPIVFDSKALVWHDQRRRLRDLPAQGFEEGANMVRLVSLHNEEASTLGLAYRLPIPLLQILAAARFFKHWIHKSLNAFGFGCEWLYRWWPIAGDRAMARTYAVARLVGIATADGAVPLVRRIRSD
jgi:GT2 family glycosyltransferase